MNGEPGTLAEAFAVDGYVAAVEFGEVTNDREAEAHAVFRVVSRIGLAEAVKDEWQKSGEMPCPLSTTAICRMFPIQSSFTSIDPLLGVNLTALASRFETICCSLNGSHVIEISDSQNWVDIDISLAPAAGRITSMADVSGGTSSVGDNSRRRFPVIKRDVSSKSSISCACESALRCMVSSAALCSSGPRAPS